MRIIGNWIYADRWIYLLQAVVYALASIRYRHKMPALEGFRDVIVSCMLLLKVSKCLARCSIRLVFANDETGELIFSNVMQVFWRLFYARGNFRCTPCWRSFNHKVFQSVSRFLSLACFLLLIAVSQLVMVWSQTARRICVMELAWVKLCTHQLVFKRVLQKPLKLL